jgi:predicted nucleic acid-binding protein
LSYLLDTCVLSEIVRPSPEPKVLQWLDAAENCYISVLTIGELQRGIDLAPDPVRRERLKRWLHDKVLAQFALRTLPVTVSVAQAWGTLHASLQKAGSNLPSIDGLLAATALIHQLTLVTRNQRDFVATGVHLLNPWM